MTKKLLYLITSVFIGLFILSASIACPILIRGLYYHQIESLDLVERSGYSEETIREAFDEMMDYCTKGGESSGMTFGTGTLKWSEPGKAHFDDVERLFSLDFTLLKISAVILILFIAHRFVLNKDDRIALGRGPLFWGPTGLLAAITVIGISAIIDFDKFFVRFHHVFFPGKENWIFDDRYDEIIKILPEDVFMNFAIVIGALVLILCVLCIVLDFVVKRPEND